MCVLLGIQYHAADFFIVPPGSAAFSRIATLAPWRAELRAAGKPAAPAPTTTTSYVASHAIWSWSTTFALRFIVDLRWASGFGRCALQPSVASPRGTGGSLAGPSPARSVTLLAYEG